MSFNKLYLVPLLVLLLILLFHSEYAYTAASTKNTSLSPLQHAPSSSHSSQHQRFPGESLADFKKPDGLKVVALIFYGRPEYVSILNCYLQRNLASRGGMLDGVLFVVRTDVAQDLAYLDRLLAQNPEYARYDGAAGRGRMYSDAWSACENGTLYIKIDDDVVFFEDHTIAALVKRKVEHPEYLLVSANGLNQPALTWVHFHLGALHAYLPELAPPADLATRKPGWRASELPAWSGPAGYAVDETTPAPFRGHRWLPVPQGSGVDITDTPAAHAEYDKAGAGFHSWAVGAQNHYSFLQNLERGELWRYKFDLWDYHFDRITVNFVAIMGDDVVRYSPIGRDDEGYLTEKIPKLTKRHAVLDGTGMAVHFGFHRQVGQNKGRALHWTDLVDRYRAYAEENVCENHSSTTELE